jgi:photosystem II stability/assembly factor-like uncharacterized protein
MVIATILFSGCTIVPAGSKTATKIDGGIWRSSDSGKTFLQVNDVLATRGKVLTMSNADINSLAFDPQDPLIMYAASAANGIFYSNDGGNSWQQFKDLKQGAFNDLAVDSQNKCVIYATTANKLFKSENCGRDWNNIYYHQKSQVILTTLALDSKSPTVLYLGTSEGEILKSTDGGRAWQTAYRVQSDKIMDIIIDPYDSKIVYFGSGARGLYKSVNAGVSWDSLGEGIKSYAGSQQYRKLIYDPATANSLIFISKFGMLKTMDGGNTWKIIDLLPSNKTTNILAVAVNPANSNEFYYVTATTLVKTIDGGVKWSSQQLPYNRLTTDIKINPVNPAIMYLTTQMAK